MIGRQQQHKCVRSGLGQRQRRHAGGGRGVAADRFENQRQRRGVDLAQLLGDDKAVLLIGDQQRRREPIGVADPPYRLLQQAVVTEQPQQLLGVERA